jgi:MFS family permease
MWSGSSISHRLHDGCCGPAQAEEPVVGGVWIHRGLIVGNGPIVFFTFGLFLGPVTKEFGWDRATFSSSLLVGHGCAAAAYPFLGRAIDRYGIRRVSLTSIVLFALSLASLSLTPPSPAVFIAMAGLVGLLSAGQAPLPYAKAVSSWFDERRGLALGIAMTGIGIGATLVPQFARASLMRTGGVPAT